MRAYLLSSEEGERNEAWRLISSIADATDLYPYLDLIDQYAALSGSAPGVAETADRIEVLFAPREERLRLLGSVVRGRGTLSRGTKFPRPFAILLAAREGLEELRPAVAQYLSAHELQRLRKRQLHSVPALFELCSGAETLLDAPRTAFTRILRMSESMLDERFADEGFREAFFDLASRASRNAGRSSPESPSVSLLRQIAARQLEYRMQSVPPSDVARSDARFLAATDWLKHLRRVLGLETGCIW
jgi:hypothetical protein